MKKFTFQRVLDGLRSSVSQQPRTDQEIVETLRPDNFQVAKTFRHGFPYQPTAVAFDPVQHLLAIGTKTGSLRLLGRPGVDSHVRHETDAAVLQITFLMNEGALVTATSDDSLHLWNFRQKRPEVVHSLKFQRERITYMHLPLQSKWLYVGTERGNIHVVNIESFVLSGYVINWNKAIEVSRKTHPGPVVHLSDNPLDASKMLIGYESGQLVLWDLRTRSAELRWQCTDPLKSVTWHHEGKQFMCSHTDGSLTTWNVRQAPKPINVSQPHAKTNKDGKPETCKPIQKVEWKSSRSGEAYVIFSGGLTYDKAGRTPSITVIHGKTTTVLEMEHNVVDFITLCESPYCSDLQEPYAIVVLLHNDLVVIDLLSQGFPCFENPYPMDLHESAVTCCTYLADCPSDLIPAFYSVGSRAQKRTGFSEREWPLCGGEWSPTSCSYNEIILTGHADGSVKFWDASAGTLQVLYKLKTSKVFDKPRTRSVDGASEDDPFAIQLISLCPESRKLCIAGASSYVILFKFRKLESVSDTCTLEIPIVYEISEEPECSPECEYPPKPSLLKGESADVDNKKPSIEYSLPIKVRSGPQKKPPGFQAHLVCITPTVNGDQPSPITALSINSSYGLMAYGNESGIVIVDIVQKCCLLNVGTPDLYGSADPYQRVPKSPKRNTTCEGGDGERCRSPSIDQVLDLDGDDSEDLSKLVVSPAGIYSSQVSPLPLDDVEPAEEAFALMGSAPEENKVEETKNDDVMSKNEEPVPKPERRSSSTWKGFNLKKQLSRVDMKLKQTFSAPTERTGKRSSVFYSSSGFVSPNERESGENSDASNSAESDDNTVIPKIKEPDETDEVGNGGLSRPTDLQLFDSQGKPLRPPRGKERKRVSLDQKGPPITGSRADGRLLSVPNIKYHQGMRDLRRKDNLKQPINNNQAFGNLMKKLNKLDSSFSRSRSSSMSSLENISSEAIQCLAFADSYTKKSEASTFPTLWVGTSLGSVLTVMISVPPAGESRLTQPVAVSPCGTIFRLKGCILTMSFLDCNGALIPYSYESWKDEGRERQKTPTRCSSSNSRMSPPLGSSMGSEVTCDRQFVALVSEKQARVVALPSHNCVYRQQLADTDFVVKAEIISLKDSVCLVCYISNGHVTAYSLPSLRPLIDIDFLPLADLRIARTFCFSNRGHGLYLSSPTEVQKFTVSAEFCSSLAEMVGDLFLPHDMPEPPKESFFRGLFGGGARSLDREELFGESSGRASRSVAKHIPGPSAQVEALGQRASIATSEIAKAHQLALERGEKLGQLEDKAEKMKNEAENFSMSAHNLMLKYKDKKWYQL